MPTMPASSAVPADKPDAGKSAKEIFDAHVEAAKKVCDIFPGSRRRCVWLSSYAARPLAQVDRLKGLTDEEAVTLRAKWGWNELPDKEVRPRPRTVSSHPHPLHSSLLPSTPPFR